MCRSGKSHVRHVYWPLMDVQLETWSRRPPESVLGSIPRKPPPGDAAPALKNEAVRGWFAATFICGLVCTEALRGRRKEEGGYSLQKASSAVAVTWVQVEPTCCVDGSLPGSPMVCWQQELCRRELLVPPSRSHLVRGLGISAVSTKLHSRY